MLQIERLYARRTQSMQSSDIRDAFKLAEQSDVISFAGGFPAPESFPVALIQELWEQFAGPGGHAAWQYGPTEGFMELRQHIAELMREEGINCGPENILITNGSQQALDLLCKVFLDPGDIVLVELPGYLGGFSAVANYEGKMVGIPLDQDGLRVDLLVDKLEQMAARGEHPKFLYTVPNFQNPAGVTLALSRRQALLELAERYDFLIVEDNPYGHLSFSGESLPHIKSLDEEGRVIYLGSFSKVFLPGVRIGWVNGVESLISQLTVAKQGTDLCSSTLGMKLVLESLRTGFLQPHVESLRILYRRRRDIMLRALETYMPPAVKWTRPEGGFFVFLTLPSYLDARAMLPFAVREERVAYVSGQAFYVDGSGHNTIRLAYSEASEEKIEEGIRRLSRVIRRRIEAVI